MKKIFMVTDMEGVAGITSFTDQSYPDGRYYDAGKKLVTAEINAAVDGLLDAGVEDILVWDGHGAGGIVFEELHPAAKLLHGRPSPPWSRPRASSSALIAVIPLSIRGWKSRDARAALKSPPTIQSASATLVWGFFMAPIRHRFR